MVRAIQNPHHFHHMQNMHSPPLGPQRPGGLKPSLPQIPPPPPSPTTQPKARPQNPKREAYRAYQQPSASSSLEERRLAVSHFKSAMREGTLTRTKNNNPKKLFEKFQQLLSLLG